MTPMSKRQEQEILGAILINYRGSGALRDELKR